VTAVSQYRWLRYHNTGWPRRNNREWTRYHNTGWPRRYNTGDRGFTIQGKSDLQMRPYLIALPCVMVPVCGGRGAAECWGAVCTWGAVGGRVTRNWLYTGQQWNVGDYDGLGM